MGVWQIEYTDQFDDWWSDLDEDTQARVAVAVQLLAEQGPQLKRPVVGQVDGSRIHNLKELRPAATSVRVLFVFDPRRAAILLLGADKAAHGWKAWYPQAIEQAERLYDEYLSELREEGLIE